MNKKLLIIFFSICIVLFGFTFQRYMFTYKFNTWEVIKNINYLSSAKFNGRLAGTSENNAAAAYIKTQFKNAGLKPLFNNYYEDFSVVYPKKVQGSPYINILDKSGNIIKSFKYGSDFKEDTLAFNQNHVSFSKASKLTLTDSLLKITSGNNICLFYVPTSNNLDFRSSFDASSKISLLIAVTQNTLNKIKESLTSDDSVDCFIPYEKSTATIHNVAGYIKGRNPSLPPVVISAHFDHMGSDLSGNIYSGALDNASGTSFVLEFAKFISSLGTPDRNIIFVAYNAEEFGFKGSSVFANAYKDTLKNSYVFNFDMIGGNNAPLSLMGGKKDNKNTALIKSIAKICTAEKVNYNYIFENSSDHTPFRKLGIQAVTFCDSDTSKIHTTKDVVRFINNASIISCFSVAAKEIILSAYSKNPFVIYNKLILLLSSLGIVLCIGYVVLKKKKGK